VFSLFQGPRHPYTLGLLASLPRIDTRLDSLLSIPGQPPSLTTPPPGCAFHPRCGLSRGRVECRTRQPELTAWGADTMHLAACHFTDEMEEEAESVSHRVGLDVRSGADQ
jgi:oligopeptide/dipeptide ABC transporter ATP-binding protein